MEVIVASNYDKMSEIGATIMAASLQTRARPVLGLATGSTPIGTYQALRRMYKKGLVDFSQTRTFNLDEYVGLSPEDPQSYYAFMYDQFFTHINISPSNIHLPPGQMEEDDQACLAYENMIDQAGGIDLQLLGLGGNGHIAFNEPADHFTAKTHLVTLDERTIADNARFFDDPSQVPRQAITMGIGSIMKARHILMLVSGQNKQEALYQMIKGPIRPQLPASILQVHPRVTVVTDQEAASQLFSADG